MAEFSASGKYRRRGPKNRFMTQSDRDSEIDRIVAMMTAGTKTADIAEAMKMSVATVYRRIDSIPKAVPPLAPQTAAAGIKRHFGPEVEGERRVRDLDDEEDIRNPGVRRGVVVGTRPEEREVRLRYRAIRDDDGILRGNHGSTGCALNEQFG